MGEPHPRGVHDLLSRSAQRFPDRIAISSPNTGRQITYADLDRLSDRLCGHLRELGISKGDRVGLCMHKSIDSVAAIFGVLKSGAAYVPVGVGSPAARNGYVFRHCGVSAIVVEEPFVEDLRREIEDLEVPLLVLDGRVERESLADFLDSREMDSDACTGGDGPAHPDDLAYVLYTSGSTGKPKGVMLSHRNATSFVDWCSEVFSPDESDRFSSHAPFHFDLSILDLFLPIKHGATVFLVDEELGKNPVGMAQLISDCKLTFWYSTPSVLTLILQHGKISDHEAGSLRFVLFAGEVFPIKHLRELRAAWPEPRFFNLYGPTETNVCTFYEIPSTIPDDKSKPYPIGPACSHVEGRVAAADGTEVELGEEGELLISGASVMQGYWELPEKNAAAFVDEDSKRWYRTGDIVVERENGVYDFIGRRDRMVKRRGFRVELGEIEAAVYGHPDIVECASISRSDDEGVTIEVIYSSSTQEPISLIALKQFSAKNLPMYMIPDKFRHVDTLPKTSTDKIDYQRLKGDF